MKNIEKYAGTKDAIEAWNKYHDGGGNMPFSEWAEMEVELPTLLDAAEALTKAWFSDGIEGTPYVIAEKISVLDDVIEREKHKPVRNCDVLSKDEVLKMLEDRSFSKEDTIEWLYGKAEGGTDGSK